MRDGHGRDPVAVALEHVARASSITWSVEADPARGAQSAGEELAQTPGAVDGERPVAATQIERLQQPGQAKPVVGVEVGEKTSVRSASPTELTQLALRALAAVEQDAVGAAAKQHRGQPAPGGRDRAGGAGKEDRQIHRAVSLSVEDHQLEPSTPAGSM